MDRAFPHRPGTRNGSRVQLTVSHGNWRDTVYTYDRPSECTCGRAGDTDIKLPSTLDNIEVSRHHCQFHIDPPFVSVSDLNSKNGTYVNEEIIGFTDDEIVELHDGDDVRVGHSHIRVHVEDETNALAFADESNSEWVTYE